MTNYLSIIFIILAAIFNSLMDIVENENFFISRFNNLLNQQFWYKRESWKYAKKLFGYKFDAWHISKTCMIFCICLAIKPNLYGLIYGLIWILVFNIFYNWIWKIKK